MKNPEANQVLNAWLLSEYVKGAEVDEKKAKWIDTTEDIVKEDLDVNVQGSLIYLGLYHAQQLRQQIQEQLFGDEMSTVNEDNKLEFCVGIFLSSDYQLKKIFVPYSAYLYKTIVDHHEDSSMDQYKVFLKQLNEILTKKMAHIRNEDLLTRLQPIDQFVCRQFGVNDFRASDTRKLLGICNYSQEPVVLDSFYVDDLQLVLNDDGEDDNIHKFIFGQGQHVDIDKNWDFLKEIIQPKNLADGRWPSAVAYRESLMQQAAINIISDQAKIKDNVRTVNGPPGTGKTTLLKDVFAGMVVDQAKAMAQLTSPKDGFEKIRKVEFGNNYHVNAYRLIPSLQGFQIIVASNNNSAVENISRDFPEYEGIQRSTDWHDDNPYKRELQEIDYFSEIEQTILGNGVNAWGTFAAPMGKKANQQKVFDTLLKDNRLKTTLLEGKRQLAWPEVVDEFNQALDKVEQLKRNLQDNIALIQSFDQSKLDSLTTQLATLNANSQQAELADYEKLIQHKRLARQHLPMKRSLLFFKKETPERLQVQNEIDQLQVKVDELKIRQDGVNRQIQDLKNQVKLMNQEKLKFDEAKTHLGTHVTIFDDQYIAKSDKQTLQKVLPGTSDELQDARAELFIAAIKLRKAFICDAYQEVTNAFRILHGQGRLEYPRDRKLLENAFRITQLLFPVMSTTLASVQSMFRHFGENSIDNVFIDEAGQASPASAIGILWRAKKLTAVGDPAQIEPVVTTNEVFLRLIARELHVDEKYLLGTTSVQNLGDQANTHGTYKQDGSWIGIPLWAHRRCKSPMFEIANKISYEGKMVQGVANAESKDFPSRWINSVGPTSYYQFVPEHEKVLVEALKKRLGSHDDAKKQLEKIYVISPFTAVVAKLRAGLKRDLSEVVGANVLSEWCRNSIGTVHTFQGKENDVVYFVIGTDKDTDGAANWSISKPNILNVAVTRAKKEFYIIGDEKRLGEKKYYEVADQLLKKNR